MALRVDVVASYDKEHTSIQHLGTEWDIVSHRERDTFNILDDDTLKNAVEKYFGKKPNDVFVHEPTTPFDDLFGNYNWLPTRRILNIKDVKIVDFEVEEVKIDSKSFENETSEKLEVGMDFDYDLLNSASSTWEGADVLTAKKPTHYNLLIKDKKGIVLDELNFYSFWNDGQGHSKRTRVHIKEQELISLDPKEKVKGTLVVTRGLITIEVDYEANLAGHVAVNYDPPYKGHHFHGLYVDEVMEAANLKNSLTAKEKVKLEYYIPSTARVDLHHSYPFIQGFMEFWPFGRPLG